MKVELRKFLKKAMVDQIPVVGTVKFSAGSYNLDRGSRYEILEPTSVVDKPECEDPSLVDPTRSKYSNENKYIKKIVQIRIKTD